MNPLDPLRTQHHLMLGCAIAPRRSKGESRHQRHLHRSMKEGVSTDDFNVVAGGDTIISEEQLKGATGPAAPARTTRAEEQKRFLLPKEQEEKQKGYTGSYSRANKKKRRCIFQLSEFENQNVKHTYHDYSHIPPPPTWAQAADAAMTTTTSANNSDPSQSAAADIETMTFLQKLHHVLNEPKFQSVIQWQSHGRAFFITSPRAFEIGVLRRYFAKEECARFPAFVEQLKNYGFKRLSKGPDRGSFYHELILRGFPHLCNFIPDPRDANEFPDPDNEPNLYDFPLPDPSCFSSSNSSTTTGNSSRSNDNNSVTERITIPPHLDLKPYSLATTTTIAAAPALVSTTTLSTPPRPPLESNTCNAGLAKDRCVPVESSSSSSTNVVGDAIASTPASAEQELSTVSLEAAIPKANLSTTTTNSRDPSSSLLKQQPPLSLYQQQNPDFEQDICRFRIGQSRNSSAVVAAALLSVQQSTARYQQKTGGLTASAQLAAFFQNKIEAMGLP